MSSILLTASRKYPSLPTVGGDVVSHTKALEALRDAVQTHERRTSDKRASFVRIQDLIDLGAARLLSNNRLEWLGTSSDGSSSGVTLLADLEDVDLTGLVDGDTLVYDATYGLWLPEAPATGGSSANVTGDTHPSVANNADDEFETGSVIDTAGTRFSGATAWTAFSTGAVTSVVGGALLLKPDLTASRKVNGYTHPVTGTWDYACKCIQSNFSTNSLVGMIIATSSGASGNVIIFGPNGSTLVVQRLSNATTFSANSLLQGSGVASHFINTVPIYLRITYDGTDFRFFTSSSGIVGTFAQVHTQSAAGFLGTPALIGVAGDNQSSTAQMVGTYDWFRKLA